jgi:transposase InsO family protein
LERGRPEYFNTDQGAQLTSKDFTSILKDEKIQISMDGKLELREQIFRFSGELSAGLPKTARRFVAEMLYGIQARQSVRLTEIGRALQEPICLKRNIG